MSKVNRRAAAPGREEIARAAVELLDEEGIDALSMRRLAERVGVGTMTLYGYFRSKRELLDAAVGEAVADFDFALPDGTLRERARAHMHAVRELLRRHPFLPALRGRQPIVHPAAFRVSEPGMRLLVDAGFPPEDAARTFRVMFNYAFGSMLFGPDAPTPGASRLVRAALPLLPDDEFPALTATADAMSVAIGGDEQFDYGLELLLDAIEARIAGFGG